jgi:DNA-binding transcriptional ArsR family regulator
MSETAHHDPLPKPTPAADMELTDVLQAMADPSRLHMLQRLVDGDWHSCGLGTWGLDLQKSTVSHHLRTMREAGLLEFRMRGRNKDARLRREVVESRFPGLLDGVLNQEPAERSGV